MTSLRTPRHPRGARIAGLCAALAVFGACGCAGQAVRSVEGDGARNDTVARLLGDWRVEHVEVLKNDGVSTLVTHEATPLFAAWNQVERTNALLNEQAMTMLRTLTADGAYVHTVEWLDAPDRRRLESGTWSIDAEHVIRFRRCAGGESSIPEATVVYVDDFTLILRQELAAGAAGACKVTRYRRGRASQQIQSGLFAAAASHASTSRTSR